MTNRNLLKTATAIGTSAVLGLACLAAVAPPAAAYPGQCGGSASDYINAPGAGGSVAFVLSTPVTQPGTQVKSVQFNAAGALSVTPLDPTETAVGGWTFEQPNGTNPNKTGVVTFATIVTTANKTVNQTVYTVPVPVCNPENLLNPTNVFQIKGDRTTVVTKFQGQPSRGEDAAYEADR